MTRSSARRTLRSGPIAVEDGCRRRGQRRLWQQETFSFSVGGYGAAWTATVEDSLVRRSLAAGKAVSSSETLVKGYVTGSERQDLVQRANVVRW